MANIRLPQTRAEIEAAAAEIVWTARNDRWSTDFGGRDLGPTRLVKDPDAPTDKKIEEWLEMHGRLGAIEKGRLIAMMELSLAPWSEDVRNLGVRRVATLLARSRWRGAFTLKPSAA